jgi:MgtE intracellular N domain/PsbP-like protein
MPPNRFINSHILLVFSLITSNTLLSVIQVYEAQAIMPSNPEKSLPTHSNFLIYTNPSLGISFQYPYNWKKLETDKQITLIPSTKGNSDKYLARLEILFVPHPNTSADAAKVLLNNYSNTMNSFKLVGSNLTNLNGIAAHVLLYTYNDTNAKLIKGIDVVTSNGESTYVISYRTVPIGYPFYLSDMYKIINSLKIRVPGGSGGYLEDIVSSEMPSKLSPGSFFAPTFLVVLLPTLNKEQIQAFLNDIPRDSLLNALSNLPSKDLVKIFHELPQSEIISLLNKIPTEDLTSILNKLPIEQQNSLKSKLGG